MQKLYILLIAILSLVFSISSCDEDDDIINLQLVVEIDSVPGEYFDMATGESMPGMWVTEEGKNDWKLWSQTRISGFTYEEGYYTRLEIIKKKSKNPSGVDGEAPSECQLLKILEKKQSDSVRTK